MAGPQKRDSGGSPPPDRESIAASEYVVARGRSLMVDGKLHGPGAAISLPTDELDHLLAAGFVSRSEPEQSSGPGVRVGGLQIKGGRKPGATVA
ncbi:hypothetical protein [Burkholderia pseudomallei]|uniref:hypothetical protein n=1 Tax=Burkholderia pseudomallei TaxID=28450 RepID=UPI0012F495DC|nr:hypothetical protein [Burkholderia pseudomallei]